MRMSFTCCRNILLSIVLGLVTVKESHAKFDYCTTINQYSANVNANTPKTWQEMKAYHLSEYDVMPPGKSIWHNLREDLDTSTLNKRLEIALQSAIEFFTKSPSDWKYLDPKWPNIKYVEKNGHREVVYNISTGARVDYGINQGTANDATSQSDIKHGLLDVPNWVYCGTPSEKENLLAQVLVGNLALKDMLKNVSPDKKRAIGELLGLDGSALENLLAKLNGEAQTNGTMEQENLIEENTGLSDIKTPTVNSHQSNSNDKSAKEDNPDDSKKANKCSQEKKSDDSQVGVRGWCTCPYRSAHITLGNLFRMGDDFKVADYSYMFCSDCYKCRKDLDDVTYLTKSGPICIWDVSIAVGNGLDGKRNPDEKTLKLLVEAQEKLMKIPDGEIVIPGLCRCASPAVWRFGRSPHKIEMCKSCGKPLSAIPLSAKNPRTPRKLRRCIKTPESPFVCTCAGETGLHPQLDASPYDEGEIQLSLMCKKCMQVKYSAFAPMREFKSKFANGKPDPQAVVEFLIGTTDLKAAMAAADKEVASQAGTGGSTRQ